MMLIRSAIIWLALALSSSAQAQGMATATATILQPPIDTSALILSQAVTTKPNQPRLALISQTMSGLKSYGIWQQCDVIYALAAANVNTAMQNLKSPGTFNAIGVNSPTFTTDRGETGDGSTSRLRTQYTPSTNAVAQTQNNASLWVWSLTNATSNASDAGSDTPPRSYLATRLLSTNAQAAVNGSGGSNAAITTSLGLIGMSRVSSTVMRAWQNGVQLGSDLSNTSTNLASEEMWVLGSNPGNFSAKQIALAMFCAAFVGAELPNYAIWSRYMTGVGAQ